MSFKTNVGYCNISEWATAGDESISPSTGLQNSEALYENISRITNYVVAVT